MRASLHSGFCGQSGAICHACAESVMDCCGKPAPDALHDHCMRCHLNVSQSLWDCPRCGPVEPSPAVTEPGSVPEPSTTDSGCSSKVQPSVCFRCGLVIFDGLHRTGHRECYMDEIEVAP